MHPVTRRVSLAAAAAMVTTTLVVPTAMANASVSYSTEITSGTCIISKNGTTLREIPYAEWEAEKAAAAQKKAAAELVTSGSSTLASLTEKPGDALDDLKATVDGIDACQRGQEGEFFVSIDGSSSQSSDNGSDSFFKDADGNMTPGGIAVIVISVLAGLGGIIAAAWPAISTALPAGLI